MLKKDNLFINFILINSRKLNSTLINAIDLIDGFGLGLNA